MPSKAAHRATRPSRIVQDGQDRTKSTPEYRAACARIEAEVQREYEPQLARKKGLARWILRWRLARELRRRRERLAPGDACYLHDDRPGA